MQQVSVVSIKGLVNCNMKETETLKTVIGQLGLERRYVGCSWEPFGGLYILIILLSSH
jgi:hypothetical protein